MKYLEKFRKRIANRDSILGLIFLAFSIILFFGIIPWQVVDPKVAGVFIAPDFFPRALAACLMFLSALLVIYGHATSAEFERSADKRITTATVVSILSLFTAIWAIRWIGMMPSGFLAMILLMRLFGYSNWKRAILISVGFIFVLFLFFERVASVDIPRGALFDGLF